MVLHKVRSQYRNLEVAEVRHASVHIIIYPYFVQTYPQHLT